LPFAQQSLLLDEGLASLDSALAINPQFEDAMTYKNLLLREKARLAVDPAEKSRLTALADDLFNKALGTRQLNAQKRNGPPRRGARRWLHRAWPAAASSATGTAESLNGGEITSTQLAGLSRRISNRIEVCQEWDHAGGWSCMRIVLRNSFPASEMFHHVRRAQ